MPAASGDQQIPRSEEVFISYSRKDKEFVRRLDEELKRRDREAWVDWEGIPPGDKWKKTIYGAIEATQKPALKSGAVRLGQSAKSFEVSKIARFRRVGYLM
jgi:hypothetical protein